MAAQAIPTYRNRHGKDSHGQVGSRNIDIDILLYGDKIVNEKQLKIPHPLMHVRVFVLEPLVEIMPDVVHPILKKLPFNYTRNKSNQALRDLLLKYYVLKTG